MNQSIFQQNELKAELTAHVPQVQQQQQRQQHGTHRGKTESEKSTQEVGQLFTKAFKRSRIGSGVAGSHSLSQHKKPHTTHRQKKKRPTGSSNAILRAQ